MSASARTAIVAGSPAGIHQPFLNRRDLGVRKLVNSDQSRWQKITQANRSFTEQYAAQSSASGEADCWRNIAILRTTLVSVHYLLHKQGRGRIFCVPASSAMKETNNCFHGLDIKVVPFFPADDKSEKEISGRYADTSQPEKEGAIVFGSEIL